MKISQAEKEGTVDKEELEKKKAALKKDMTQLLEKRKALEEKLKSLKK